MPVAVSSWMKSKLLHYIKKCSPGQTMQTTEIYSMYINIPRTGSYIYIDNKLHGITLDTFFVHKRATILLIAIFMTTKSGIRTCKLMKL